MAQEDKAAVATTVIGESETLLAILPAEEGLLIETMYYDAEVRPMPKAYQKQAPAAAELEMAKTLIHSMIMPFKPEEYRNEYQERLRIALEKKILGEKIIIVPQQDEGDVGDLMEALQLSVQQRDKEKVHS